MSTAVYGALLGLVVAAIDYLLLRALSKRVELPETRRVLQITGASQFVLLPIIGYIVAPYVVGE